MYTCYQTSFTKKNCTTLAELNLHWNYLKSTIHNCFC